MADEHHENWRSSNNYTIEKYNLEEKPVFCELETEVLCMTGTQRTARSATRISGGGGNWGLQRSEVRLSERRHSPRISGEMGRGALGYATEYNRCVKKLATKNIKGLLRQAILAQNSSNFTHSLW